MNEEIKLVIATSWNPNLYDFFNSLGISSGSLGAELFENVFNCFFLTSIDLKCEYEDFYSIEYSSLKLYAEIRYGKIIDDNEFDAEYIYLVTCLPQIVDPGYEDNKLEAILQVIKVLEGANNED